MSTAPTPPSRESSTGTVERLHVLWIVSALMLVLLVVIVTLLGSGQLRRHAGRISEQTQAIDRLREDLSQTRKELMDLKVAMPFITQAGRVPPASVEGPHEPAPVAQEEGAEPRPAEPVPMAPDDIDALLRRALQPSEGGLYDLADRAAAEQALQAGVAGVGQAAWGGETWVRLAVIARLLDREAEAETFAGNARAANEFPRAYYELSARAMLAQRRARDAIVFARPLAAGRPQEPQGALLLAEAYRLSEDLTAADAALENLADPEHLSLADKLRLGGLFVALERWDRLDALLASLGEAPESALAQLNYLRAVLWIQQGKLPEALATLDNLLAEQPDDYELRTWRGVALLYARQLQAAREALAHAEQHRDRPEAWYWRGILELQAGNVDEAITALQTALAASSRCAPASEALATIALNRGDLLTALQNIEHAVNVSPRRASAHFLLALIHAKASHLAETAAALRTAFRLDPAFLDTARQTEAIRGLFSEDQLAALAAPTDVDPGHAPAEPDEARPD